MEKEFYLINVLLLAIFTSANPPIVSHISRRFSSCNNILKCSLYRKNTNTVLLCFFQDSPLVSLNIFIFAGRFYYLFIYSFIWLFILYFCCSLLYIVWYSVILYLYLLTVKKTGKIFEKYNHSQILTTCDKITFLKQFYRLFM